MSTENPEPGWRAYGGHADRHASGRARLVQAQDDLAGLTDSADLERFASQSPSNAIEVAEHLYRLGRAYTFALHLPPQERFERAHDSHRDALNIGGAHATASQRSRWWTGLGSALKNRVSPPDGPDEHREHLEQSVAAHQTALQIARESGDEELVAAATAGLGLSYSYREAGLRNSNLLKATNLLAESYNLRVAGDQPDRAAIVATTCGIVLSDASQPTENFRAAMGWFRRARDLLDADELPAQARRLGRTAGLASMRLGEWDEAVTWYDLARQAMLRSADRTSNAADRRREIAEFGDASGRHVMALAMAGQLNEAVNLAEEYLGLLPADAAATVPATEPEPAGNIQVPDQATSLGKGQAPAAYLLTSQIGSAAILTNLQDEPGVLFTDAVTSTWLKDQLAWPSVPPGHGSYVTSRLIGDTELDNRDFAHELLANLSAHLLQPLREAATVNHHDHLVLIPMGVLTDAPLAAAWAHPHLTTPVRSPSNQQATSPTTSIAPSGTTRRIRVTPATTRQRPHLITVAASQTSVGDLPWTDAESRAIEDAFIGPVTSLRGPDATRAQVAAAMKRATHIHFAGHGEFTHANPDETRLLCADGPLYIRELLESDAFLNAELVIASACSLGASDTFVNPDGGFGLPRLLTSTYNCGLVAPIRPVYDAVAAMFAARFAQLLWNTSHGQTPANAFSQTQAWLAKADNTQLQDWATAHPRFGLDELIADRDPQTWIDRPDIWAPFTYFAS